MFQSNYGHILHEINKIHTGRTTNQDKCMYIVFVIFSIFTHNKPLLASSSSFIIIRTKKIYMVLKTVGASYSVQN